MDATKIGILDSLDKQKKYFWLLCIITLIIKLFFSFISPPLGDEVYWIQPFKWGYYGHPPMVAWILSSASLLSTSPIILRLPQQLAFLLIVFLVIKLVRDIEPKKAYLAGILLLVSPIYLLNIFMLTDSPLMFFSFLMIFAAFYAVKRQSLFWFALTGVFFGCAFFSKYLILPVFLGLVIGYFLTGRKNIRLPHIFIFSLAAAPFLLENLFWNINHNWINVAFNCFLRIKKIEPLKDQLSFFASVFVVFSPFSLFYFVKYRTIIIKYFIEHRKTATTILFSAFFVPLIFYFLLSFRKDFGLHWLFSFYTFFILVLAITLNQKTLRKLIIWFAIYSALALLIVSLGLALPLKIYKPLRLYNGIIYSFKTKTIVDQMSKYQKQNYIIGTQSYSNSAILGCFERWHVITFGSGSVYGRNDDFRTDFKQLNHRNFALLGWNDSRISKFAPYFQTYTVKHYQLDDVPYCIFVGQNFNYPKYRIDILKPIWERFYQPGLNLPFAKDYFGKKYSFSS